jgi:hypothetical protein
VVSALVSAATGRSTGAAKCYATRATKIPGIDQLAGTSLDRGDELDALAKLPPEQQAPIIEQAKSGEKVSAKGAALV